MDKYNPPINESATFHHQDISMGIAFKMPCLRKGKQSASKLFNPQKWLKIFLPLKFHCHVVIFPHHLPINWPLFSVPLANTMPPIHAEGAHSQKDWLIPLLIVISR